jgi:riboflavin biosynthesis pyrimidine reductase
LFPSPAPNLSDAALLADAATEPETGSGSFVRFSMVASLDGRISVGGLSAPLSSAADARRFQLLRCVSDAVVVGSGTAVAEDYKGALLPPGLQRVRKEHGFSPLPTTVVLSASASIAPGADVFTDAPAPTLVVVAQDAPVDRVTALESVLGDDGVVTVPTGADPRTITEALAARGLRHLHHEGGPTVLGRYLAVDAVDSLCLTISPSIVGQGPGLTGGTGLKVPAGFGLHTLYEEDSFLLADYRAAA